MRRSGGTQGVGERLRAVGYVRVSTDQQAMEGVSLEAQQVRIRAHCVSQDIELIDIVIDEGFSAKSLERQARSPDEEREGPRLSVRFLLSGGTPILAAVRQRFDRYAVGERKADAQCPDVGCAVGTGGD